VENLLEPALSETIDLEKYKARLLANRHVDPDGCWIWTGAKTRNHGHVKIDDVHYQVHRLAVQLWRGVVVGRGLFSIPSCGKTLCFRPECHEVKTRSEFNLSRRMLKPRCPSGHEFTAENTYVDRRGWRHCRACMPKFRAASWRRRRQSKHKAVCPPFVPGDPRPPLSARIKAAAISDTPALGGEGLPGVARLEAQSLLALVVNGGETVRSIRELIGIDECEERTLLAFMQAHPAESGMVRRAIAYRAAVLEAFDRLAKREEYAERIAAADIEAAGRAALNAPVPSSRSELVVAAHA
jgi:hypothetical protein